MICHHCNWDVEELVSCGGVTGCEDCVDDILDFLDEEDFLDDEADDDEMEELSDDWFSK